MTSTSYKIWHGKEKRNVKIGTLGLQLATECGPTFRPASGAGTRCAGNNLLRVTGHVDLPFELGGIKKDILVSIIPDLEVDCYVGSNFVREFKTMHDPVENRLIVGKSEKNVGLCLHVRCKRSVTDQGRLHRHDENFFSGSH